MLIKSIKIFVTLIFFLSTIQSAFSESLIIPKQKPTLTKEKKYSADFIIPKFKPGTIKSKEDKEITKEKDAKIVVKKIDGIIIPKNKPLIVKKQRLTRTKKSKFYSDRDLNYARQAISFMEKSNWKDALKVAKKARAKSIYDFIEWRYLLTTGNRASFYDYKNFIERVKTYPRLDRIKYLGEHKLSTRNQSPKQIIQWFDKKDPLSGFGEMILGESLIKTGKKTDGIKLIKKGFITADLTKNDLINFRKKFKKYLSSDDYIKRADYLAWENKYWDLKRMLRYLPKDYQLLYTARQILMSNSYGVDTAISKVPDKFKNDAGLNYNRLKWRIKRGRLLSLIHI